MIRPFVNRIEEIRHLNRALKYNGQESPVFVFTGIGGIGKTAIRISFEEKLLKPKRIPYAVLDYDGDPNLRPIEVTLRAIRRQLGRLGVKTPVFDYLYARFFELSMGVKLSKTNYPLELEGVVNILEGIPFVGNFAQISEGLSKLGLAIKERLQHKDWLYRIRELEPREVLNLLPEVLADDLEEAMTTQSHKILKSSGCRIVLLLDAYELVSESQLDDTLHRKLLLLTPHLLRVIFTRAPLPWEHKFPKEWKGKITHFPALEVLSQEDAIIFLQKKSVDDPELQEYLYQLTGGYPLQLEICADICLEIEEVTNMEACIQDFEGASDAVNLTEDLVNRFLRQMEDDERDLMGLASYPRWITEEILDILSSVPESVHRIYGKIVALSMFSPHAEIPEAYVLRKEVRYCLINQQKKKHLWKVWHGKLLKFHQGKWEETKSYYHLREVLYHSFYENPEGALKLFDGHFWGLLDEYKFAEAEGLLHAVPMDVLNDEKKRRIDYARARLLTASMQSRDSLITARNLYESLVVSEAEETALEQYLFYFAKLLREMADFEKALEYHQKALAIRLKIYGKEHPEVADSYHSIGAVYYTQGKYEKVPEYLQKALAIRLKVYGEEHPDVAASYNNIGVVYHSRGKYEKALEYHQKALVIRLKVYGEEHPDAAHSYNNIGIVYDSKGKYEKALDYYQKALVIRLKVYGEEHPEVAHSYHNIGIVYSKQGKYEKALDYYQKALVIRLKIHGEEHTDVASSYNNIGIVYNNQGKYEKALEYHQKALAIRLKVYGEEHPHVAFSYANIGVVYKKQGKYEKAFEYHQKALAIHLKVYGEEHPYIAISYSNIGVVYKNQGKYEKALEYHQKALNIRLKILGEEHPDIAASYNNIGEVYDKQGKYEKALEYHQKELAIHLKAYGEEHPYIASSYHNIGVVYYYQGKYEKALEYHQKALAIKMKIFGEEHPRVADSYKDTGSTLWALKKENEAFEKIHKSTEIYRKSHLWKEVIENLDTLAGWLEEKGEIKGAEEARKEANKIRNKLKQQKTSD